MNYFPSSFPVAVPGEGPLTASGVIVGEAGGRDEVEAGKPFVGSAGRRLDTWLSEHGLRRDALYITNAYKGDVGSGDPDPTAEQLKDHHWLLALELALVRPTAVPAVGKVAARALLPHKLPTNKTSLDAVVGRSHVSPFSLGRVFVCPHPADRPWTSKKQADVDRALAGLPKKIGDRS